jgi:hypothetical protein
MSKKDIATILKEGTPKQRLLIVAEHIARGSFDFNHPDLSENKEPLLTDKEFTALSDSFKTSQEIRLYNKWRQYDRVVRNSLVNLQGLRFEVKMHYSNLRGYILVWNAIENAEQLVNSVLHEVKDTKERIRIAKGGAEGVDLLFTDTTIDPEGYLDLKIDFEKETYRYSGGKPLKDKETRKTKEYSLLEVMNNVKKQATASAITFISWRQALLDYMDKRGFNIKTYKDMIRVISQDVYSPIIGWEKYLSESKNFITLRQSNKETTPKRVDKLKPLYSITPVVSELEVDKEMYEHYMKNYLEDE